MDAGVKGIVIGVARRESLLASRDLVAPEPVP